MLKSTFCPLLCGSIIKNISVHLIFCHNKHLLGKYYLQCPYNENHILSKKIYENHIENCIDKPKRKQKIKNKRKLTLIRKSFDFNISQKQKDENLNNNDIENSKEEEENISFESICVKIIEAHEEEEGLKNLEENILKLELDNKEEENEKIEELKMNSKFNKIKEEKIEFELNDFSKKEQEKNKENFKEDDFYLNDILIKNDNHQLFYLNCDNLCNKLEEENLSDRIGQKEYSLSTNKSDNSDIFEDKIKNEKNDS